MRAQWDAEKAENVWDRVRAVDYDRVKLDASGATFELPPLGFVAATFAID